MVFDYFLFFQEQLHCTANQTIPTRPGGVTDNTATKDLPSYPLCLGEVTSPPAPPQPVFTPAQGWNPVGPLCHRAWTANWPIKLQDLEGKFILLSYVCTTASPKGKILCRQHAPLMTTKVGRRNITECCSTTPSLFKNIYLWDISEYTAVTNGSLYF